MVSCELSMVQVVYVSRHGIRTPYPADNGTVTDYSSYTPLIFPDETDWNMTYDAFANQYLTPHGQVVMSNIGSYYKDRWGQNGLGTIDCDRITCYADFSSDATRDRDSAMYWLNGFELCPNLPIILVNDTTNSNMEPVLSDHYLFPAASCQLATEEQVNGLYGGDVDALTEMYYDSIQQVNEVLNMTEPGFHADVCQNINPEYDESAVPAPNCTLFETGYEYTGVFYNGMFTSPMYSAGYFAENWMFQYLGNVETWAFDQIPFSILRDLYSMHIESMWFGTNYWNSNAYSSQQLSYIMATMDQYVTGTDIDGVPQSSDQNVVLLFSHDTNILYLRRLLGVNWIPVGYGSNVASPGGALSFELWHDDAGSDTDIDAYFVKLLYIAPSPDQQRNAEVLNTDTNEPSIATLVIPDCGLELCPFSLFKSIVLTHMNSECILEPFQTSIRNMQSQDAQGNNNNDDGDFNMSGWQLVGTTIGFMLGLIFVLGVFVYYYNKTQYKAINNNNNDEDKLKRDMYSGDVKNPVSTSNA